MKKSYCFLILTLLLSSLNTIAQTLPTGGLLENVEDAYRRQQLLGNDHSARSYMIRPLFLSDDDEDLLLDEDPQDISLTRFRTKLYEYPKLDVSIYALPLVWQNQINSHHPYGINDGSMVQAKGYETQVSGGIYAKVGPLSVQFRPEYVYAQNKTFQKLYEAPNGVFYYTPIAVYYNTIDLPDRFGDEPYSKFSWGQSSIRLTAGPVSFGFSNENLWWGPGVKNSLLMTNNASGFRHLTLNTVKPIKTYIGSFEAQIIGGRLQQSGVATPQLNEYIDKIGDWRYLSAYVLTYQPKWVPNLYLGYDRSFVINRRDMGRKFGDYFPIFGNLTKKESTGNADAPGTGDQYISFFSRYVLPESKAEVYFEYGRNDHSYDQRDFFVEPEHTRAYVLGFRKLIDLPAPDEFIQLGVELTQLERSTTRETRASETWYSHYQVKDGYTNQGQILGAGIGPGSNLQTLDVSWVKGLKRIGLQFERTVNNNDLFYRFAYRSSDKSQWINRHWIDLSVGGNFAWTYKNFILNSQLTYIRSLNYQYQWQPGASYWDWDKQDVNNFHFKLGLLYNW